MAWRRRRSRIRRLRRYFIDHRFSAAEAVFGLSIGALGVWLIWPQPEVELAGQRDPEQPGLAAYQEQEDTAAPGADAPASSAEASGSISAKRHLAGRLSVPGSLFSATLDQAALAAALPERGAGKLAVDPLPQGEEERENELDVAALPAFRVGPRIEDGERPAWLRHAVQMPRAHDRPMIAVVIDDLGMNRRNTAALNQLQAPLTLAFLPYAGELERQTNAARAAGHELLLHMPMEPEGTDWPGPGALLSTIGPDEFRARLGANLDSFGGFVGLNNHMGSRLTADRAHMDLIMAELRRRSLLFVDSKTTARSIGHASAQSHDVPFVQRDVFLDNVVDRDHVQGQLELIERIARRRGAAVAIGHPHEITIAALRRWLPTLEQRGFVLVPISSVVAWSSCPAQAPAEACGDRSSARPSLPGGELARQG